ncbi:class I SAM-dependent methyltransferase [Pseudothermotoga thermarum]|uniref:Nucleic acid binding OB-fold tRNA/helicase-type n=1 Tax=Pseudothermotoga thermarum DSM 5069 TaxID=688269 RepID=F7YTJ9_9THEM|nr:class I SAM-dependent methyltransferase [Pseudothermotoga thermarum]AEH51217.1 nucleic acid binding OB-fold tRNA/helicase-type [Pseudothermotoga thermarum DSM 5069]
MIFKVEFPTYLEQAVRKITNQENISIDCIVKALEGMYNKNEENLVENYSTNYSKEKKIAYLWYYFPYNLFKIHRPLSELHSANLLPEKVNVLDIACGPGTLSVGIAEFYKKLALKNPSKSYLLRICLVDKEEEFLSYAKILLDTVKDSAPKNLKIVYSTVTQTIQPQTRFRVEELFDIICAGNFLNYYEHGKKSMSYLPFFENVLEILDEKGSLILIEQSKKELSRPLKGIRDILVKSRRCNLFSPCLVDPSNGNEKCYDCYQAFEVEIENCGLIQALVDCGANKRKHHTRHPFSYVILRKDGQKRFDKGQRSSRSVFGVVKAKSWDHNSFAICDGENEIWVRLPNHDLIRRIDTGAIVSVKSGRILCNQKEISVQCDSQIEIIREF